MFRACIYYLYLPAYDNHQVPGMKRRFCKFHVQLDVELPSKEPLHYGGPTMLAAERAVWLGRYAHNITIGYQSMQ